MPPDDTAALLRQIAEGRLPRAVPEGVEHAEEIRKIVGFLLDVQTSLRNLSEGTLDFEVPQRGPFAGSIKAMQASLRHLTWQTHQVAEGDFDQRVDFMGEFAASFNTMVEKLKTSRDTIVQRNAALEEAYRQLKESQEQLLEHEKLASIGQLAAGIAHEINNPLAAIASNLNRFDEFYTDMLVALQAWRALGAVLVKEAALRAHVEQVQKEEHKAGVAFIEEDFPQLMKHSRDGASRIRAIVSQMRIFADTEKTPFEICEVHHVMERAVADLSRESRPGIAISAAYEPVGGVRCKPEELRLVFMHLLRNAVQAITNDGAVRVHVGPHEGHVQITVDDTGCGIPAEHLGQIFNPFFTTRPVGMGVGLGLFIVGTIVNSIKGTIAVDSTVGTGTRVTITIPVYEVS